jgi:hypothetical protein
VLAIDDGSAFVLDMGYVLGREPQHDPEVLSGAARPLKIVDAEGVVSRRHVRVALVGWDIQVMDLGSANGTFVQFPGDPQVQQLTASTRSWSGRAPRSRWGADGSGSRHSRPTPAGPDRTAKRPEQRMRGIADYEFLRPIGGGGNGRSVLARRPPRLPATTNSSP